MISGIVYLSRATIDFDFDDLKVLSNQASIANGQFSITGYLYFEKGYFLQYIEGEMKAVNTLLNNIKQDDRHEVLNIQVDKEIETRKFPTWHMHQLTKSSLMQINMENVLIDYLTYSSNKNSEDINKESIWRMVDKLSKFRKRLSYSLG